MEWPDLEEAGHHVEVEQTEVLVEGEQAQAVEEESILSQSIESEEASEEQEGGETGMSGMPD